MQALVSHRNAFFMWKDYKRFILSESAAEELFSLVLKVISKTSFETFTFTFCSLVLKYKKVISKTFFETFTFTCFSGILISWYEINSSYRVIIYYLTFFSLSVCVFVFPMYLSLYLSFPSLLWFPWHFPKVAARPGTVFVFWRTNRLGCEGRGGDR